MRIEIWFIAAGYLSGSILFARLVSALSKKENFLQDSPDHNPGAANAFRYGGFLCGMITLLGDMMKGFFPVHIYLKYVKDMEINPFLFALILAAPVIGHAFPAFYGFQGGKGIAVTFGCLLGLYPWLEPVLTLAVIFLFFSLILCITPHLQRTKISYITTLICFVIQRLEAWITGGFAIILVCVCIRLHLSKEERQKMKVRLLWLH